MPQKWNYLIIAWLFRDDFHKVSAFTLLLQISTLHHCWAPHLSINAFLWWFATDTLWHSFIDLFTYSDDQGSLQSGLCLSRERSLPSRRGHMWAYRSFPAAFETAAGVRGLNNNYPRLFLFTDHSRIQFSFIVIHSHVNSIVSMSERTTKMFYYNLQQQQEMANVKKSLQSMLF